MSKDSSEKISQPYSSTATVQVTELRYSRIPFCATMRSLFALSIFCGAFLLFQVQPLIGKFILPWFGGSPAVWTTCMLFFQVLLLAGYAYAHFSSRCFSPRMQAMVHLVLLACAIAFLPITPSEQWKPTSAVDPTWHILKLLLVSLGLPYFVLSSTGPLMQEWFRQLNPNTSPYRLYALSNLGSLLALISYPFAFEPVFSRRMQGNIWGWGLGLFVILCGLCAIQLWRLRPGSASTQHTRQPNDGPAPLPAAASTLLWFGLPACASLLLLAFTSKMCQDVAVIPFLWVMPLSLYLLSFIICFDSPALYSRKPYTVAFLFVLVLVCAVLFGGASVPILLQVGIYGVALFICCMICHGELYRLKPDPRFLTSYYLAIAAGGAGGGAIVALAAPLLFNSYVELHWGLWICAVLLVILYRRDQTTITLGQRVLPLWPIALAATILLGTVLRMQVVIEAQHRVLSERNFYGVLRVYEVAKDDPANHCRVLQVGQILHGMQFMHPLKAARPTSYFHEQSGIGIALRSIQRPEGRRLGVVGLGIGTLSAYGRSDDYLRYYEINPEVKSIAQSHFSYLAACTARVDVVLGDGRLSLETEPPQYFDLLALDAFSGDAIPVHLLTREAFAIYMRHLKPDGVIAVNISNRHLDIRPVVEKLAAHFQLHSVAISSPVKNLSQGLTPSDWMLLTRNKALADQYSVYRAPAASTKAPVPLPMWTDDYTSIFRILK